MRKLIAKNEPCLEACTETEPFSSALMPKYQEIASRLGYLRSLTGSLKRELIVFQEYFSCLEYVKDEPIRQTEILSETKKHSDSLPFYTLSNFPDCVANEIIDDIKKLEIESSMLKTNKKQAIIKIQQLETKYPIPMIEYQERLDNYNKQMRIIDKLDKQYQALEKQISRSFRPQTRRAKDPALSAV